MKTLTFMGEPDIRTVVLSQREREMLDRVSNLLFRLREQLEREKTVDDKEADYITDIALAAHTCRDLAVEGEVPVR